MINIAEIDKNFEVKTLEKRDNVIFINARKKPFVIYGLMHENGRFRRMPEKVAFSVSEAVSRLHAHTAGGRVRFITDSSYIAISAAMSGLPKFSHCAFTATMGFDMYADGVYTKTFIPPFTMTDGYESDYEFADKKTREIMIDFPLYSGVEELYIGLEKDCYLAEPVPYKYDKPVVFYGSSITQGGCASRPGTCYEAILSRRFNCDYVNLGFSGSGKAEDEIIDYIKKLDMKMFVYDYDFNAPDYAHLLATHEKMFLAIREEHPDLPIIIMSKPRAILDEKDMARRNLIEKTYLNALARGDKNVYFLDGPTLMHLCGNEGTVDRTHPTDFGFASMAITVGNLIEEHKLL